jgi:hypothetical protein
MYRLIVAASLCLLCSCQHTTSPEFTKFYEDGRAKPVVAIAPIIDTSSFDMSWSLSEELQDMLVDHLAKKGTIYIPEQSNVSLHSSENPFGSDLSWVKREFAPNEFVVFLEVIQHEHVPARAVTDPLETASTNLNIAARVRIVDIRSGHPKIVLQELIKDSYFFPKNILPVDYSLVSYGTEDFLLTPIGVAHGKFAKLLVERLNDYILLAKSRWNG